MNQVEFQSVTKVFGGARDRTPAVQGVSWQAAGGEVFGLLGPNGAGKTTMIRMLLDILRPDSGDILVNGRKNANRDQAFRQRIGYLPEERGLYRKRKVLDVLLYLAALKGMSRRDAERRAMPLLARFGLSDWAKKKIGSLSKGMSQKLQIISCVLHDPDLVVFDEPFSGLDPVNVRLVRELVLELRTAGKLVFLSTHLMAEVEAMCDRFLMLHRGRQLLYGPLRDIRRAHTDYQAFVDPDAQVESLACVQRVIPAPGGKRVYLKAGMSLHDLMSELGSTRRAVRRVEEGALPLEDIFVSLVGPASELSAAAVPIATLVTP